MMLRKPWILARIDEICDRQAAELALTSSINASHIEGKLLRIAQLAQEEKKYSDANRAWELIGKLRGLFRDTLDVDVSTSADVDQARQAECRRIAAAMLSVNGTPKAIEPEPVIDVDATPLPAGCLASLPVVTSGLSSSNATAQAQENDSAGPPRPPCTPGDHIQ